jgi:hypothetical protein
LAATLLAVIEGHNHPAHRCRVAGETFLVLEIPVVQGADRLVHGDRQDTSLSVTLGPSRHPGHLLHSDLQGAQDTACLLGHSITAN